MAVTEQQLQTWARHVTLMKNQETYRHVKSLFQNRQFNSSSDFEIYLQGSVANDTNIYADGDIDIVFQYNWTYFYNYDRSYGESIYNNPSSYTLGEFRNEVESILRDKGIKYGRNNKCIKLKLRGAWQDVDLIPCFQYRNHYGSGSQEYWEGIKIKLLRGGFIENYPKEHKKNGSNKDMRTHCYKDVVRIFKNIKKNLVEEGKCNENLAPSYFIECLLYNVPDGVFYQDSYQVILLRCLNFLLGGSISFFKCQNEIEYLFGNESTQWNEPDCRDFLAKIVSYITA